MDELLQETRNKSTAEIPGYEEVISMCKLLEEHKGDKVTALDLRKLNLWTDFFIIATVASSTHLQGLLRHIKEFADEEGLTIHRRTQKHGNTANRSFSTSDRSHGFTDGAGFAGGAVCEDGGWNLVDMGTAVIHLMTAQSREFYELEELWNSAGQIYPL